MGIRTSYGNSVNVDTAQFESRVTTAESNILNHSSQLADIVTHVKKFGAVGDGVIDDTTAIQNAINSISTTGGIIQLSGVHLISDSLIIPDNITIIGNATIKIGNNVNLPAIKNSDNVNGNKNITIKDIKIEGNSVNNGTAAIGISFDKVTNTMIENVTINDCKGYAILFQNSAQSHVERCKLSNSDVGINVLYSNYMHITNCISHDHTVYCYRLITCDHVDVVACDGWNSYDDILFIGDLTGRCTHIRVMGCAFYGSQMAGIHCLGNRYITLTGIVSYNNARHGICVTDDAYDVTVSGCSLTGNSMNGLWISAANKITATGNTCEFNSYHGILLQYATNVVISGNVCMNNDKILGSRDGINIDNTTYSVITGNRCGDDQATKSQFNGIQEGASDYNIITNNILSGNRGTSLVIVGANTVSANNIV